MFVHLYVPVSSSSAFPVPIKTPVRIEKRFMLSVVDSHFCHYDVFVRKSRDIQMIRSVRAIFD